MKNLERDRRRKKGAIGSQDGGFRTFERRTRGADGRSATCILEEGWERSDVLYGFIKSSEFQETDKQEIFSVLFDKFLILLFTPGGQSKRINQSIQPVY